MSFPEMIDAYLAAVPPLRQAVAGMTADQQRARPVAGKWSTLEVVCHLSDTELIYADRIKRILVDDQALFIYADETRYAADLPNHERDLEEELGLIELTRKHMARMLRALPPASLTRAGTLRRKDGKEEPRTIEMILKSANNHIPHHLPFIQEKRQALGLAKT